MKISGILQTFKAQIFSRKTVEQSAAAEKSAPVRDLVDISAAGRSLQRSESDVAIAMKALQEVPPVREDRLAEVREKLARGEYVRPGFFQELSARMIESGEFRDVFPVDAARASERTEKPAAETPLQQERTQRVQEKVTSGFYNDPRVREETAERLLKNFGL